MSKLKPITPKKKPPAKRPSTPPGEVRIIGGQWKRTKLSVAHFPGLRPTPDRVRETVFNWLGQDMSDKHCVDAFAGTGVLGFEAASRGAAHVLMVEQQAQVLSQLLSTVTKLQANMVKVERGDGVSAMKMLAAKSIDVVFLDPPFDAIGVADAALAAARRVVKDGGYIYYESPKALTEDAAQELGLQLHRHGKAGMVHYHLLQCLAAHSKQNDPSQTP
ncbi:MAG TPA: 16S rRNA (guanine(966)-N(2))-methyltransferase RsmD [Burkholderiaceae bacterium]|nr:16S rRNA (guanine(966)-N(2))-methyltransferase RsmD [Burkholderiaceae bacterium]